MSYFKIFESDLYYILSNSINEFKNLDKSTVTIFGCNGFVGKWLTSSFLFANQYLNLDINLILYTRNIDKFMHSLGIVLPKKYNVIESDFSIVSNKHVNYSDYYFHLATSSTIKSGSGNEKNVLDSTLNVIHSTVSSLQNNIAPPIFIHASSGAVYTDTKNEDKPYSEVFQLKNVEESSIYRKSKILAEEVISDYTAQGLIRGINPRLFSFAGPHLVLDEHFAIGNFIKNLIDENPIFLSGSPLTKRSYLYPADLIIWLLKLSQNPLPLPFNFGSDIPISMLDLAKIINCKNKYLDVVVNNSDQAPSFYYPSIENVRTKLDIQDFLNLDQIIDRWISWIKVTNS